MTILNNSSFVYLFSIIIAWLLGEIIHNYLPKIPKVSVYLLIGFIFTKDIIGLIPNVHNTNIIFLVHIAFGFIVFECGYRVNLNWLKDNPYLIVMTLLDAIVVFIIIYSICNNWLIQNSVPSLIIATIAMSMSPIISLIVINQAQASGQVSERILHLSLINFIFTLLVFKLISSIWIYQDQQNFHELIYHGIISSILSIALGIVMTLITKYAFNKIGSIIKNTPMFLTLAIILIITTAQSIQISSILAIIIYGLTSRYLNAITEFKQYQFGILGKILTVFLFVVIGSTFVWHQWMMGVILAILIIAIRIFSKMLFIVPLSYRNGISWTKATLLGFATTPVSLFLIFSLNQLRQTHTTLFEQLAPISLAIFLLELFGPIIIRHCLVSAKEIR